MTDGDLIAVNMTGGGDFASALLFVTVVSYARHRQWSYELLLHVVNTLFRARA